MLASLSEIKDRLVDAVDDNGSIRDMDTATEAISALEKKAITTEELERTRLGLHVNNIRRASRNSPLAKRAKNLIKSWQQMIEKKNSSKMMTQSRPETPNSVGSSPSPPEPTIVHSHSSPLFTAQSGRSKAKRQRTPADKQGKRKDVIDGIRKVQSSKSNFDKQSLDTGQSKLTNGLKTYSSVQSVSNQNSSNSVQARSPSATSDIKLSVSHKSSKKKKSRNKSPHSVPSPAPNNQTPDRSQLHEASHNSKTNFKMKGSKSTPNFTVHNSTLKEKSSHKELISNPLSQSSTSSGNKKRKRASPVDMGIAETPGKLRKTKERRLTYDPLTNKIQVPGQEKNNTVNSFPKKSFEKSPPKPYHDLKKMINIKQEADRMSYDINNHAATELKPRLLDSELKTLSIKDDDKIDESEETPSRICPSVKIIGTNPSPGAISCDGACSSSTIFNDIRKEFKKRKTRRKDPNSIELEKLYPYSSLFLNMNSDSDEDSDFESSFCSSLKANSSNPPHTQNCRLPGVTGCRGSNGSWFDWTETFCVRNHKDSMPLPEEKEILPLQIFPYVELD